MTRGRKFFQLVLALGIGIIVGVAFSGLVAVRFLKEWSITSAGAQAVESLRLLRLIRQGEVDAATQQLEKALLVPIILLGQYEDASDVAEGILQAIRAYDSEFRLMPHTVVREVLDRKRIKQGGQGGSTPEKPLKNSP
jgi:hypothetical protein